MTHRFGPKATVEALAAAAGPFLEPGETVAHVVQAGAGEVHASYPVDVDGVLLNATISAPSVLYAIVATDRNLYVLRLERGYHRQRKPEAVFLKVALDSVSVRSNPDRIYIRTDDDPLERGFKLGGLGRKRAKQLVEYVESGS